MEERDITHRTLQEAHNAESTVTLADEASQEEAVSEHGEGAAAQELRTPAGERDRNRRNQRKPRRSGRREERARSEFDQKMISIRRVARVMAGGRRFNFSVAVVIGNKKGKVGVGIGKAADTQLAMEKAVRDAKKNLIELPLDKRQRIPHDVQAKVAASVVKIIPAAGRGLVAGSSVRTVLELGGVTDVTGKLLSRSKNKLNNARAAIAALKKLKR